jgi:hypothetical protein
MPDLTTISVALSSLKTSMDIAKTLKDSTKSLSDAEQKLKVAELISSLADLKTELADVKINLIDKDDEIRKLNEIINEKESLSFDGKFYRKKEDSVPFCPICWELNQKAIHLEFFNSHARGKIEKCNVCKNSFEI